MFIFLIGIMAGCLVFLVIFRIVTVGTLQIVIDDSESEPYLFLEVSKDINQVIAKRYILLKVNCQKYRSHR